MTEYGTPAEDLSAYHLLVSLVPMERVKHILHHPRMPIDARPCRLPGSLLVQAVLVDGTVVSVRQPSIGAKPRRI